MSGSDEHERASRWAAAALAHVLDLPGADLRADSPLDDLGADSIARVQWADVVERLAAQDGALVRVDDAALAGARTLGELADHVAASLAAPAAADAS